jgi:hypothetical protein
VPNVPHPPQHARIGITVSKYPRCRSRMFPQKTVSIPTILPLARGNVPRFARSYGDLRNSIWEGPRQAASIFLHLDRSHSPCIRERKWPFDTVLPRWTS